MLLANDISTPQTERCLRAADAVSLGVSVHLPGRDNDCNCAGVSEVRSRGEQWCRAMNKLEAGLQQAAGDARVAASTAKTVGEGWQSGAGDAGQCRRGIKTKKRLWALLGRW